MVVWEASCALTVEKSSCSLLLLLFPERKGGEGSKELMFTMKKNAWRAVIEVGSIVFLFYSNLLMGEFER